MLYASLWYDLLLSPTNWHGTFVDFVHESKSTALVKAVPLCQKRPENQKNKKVKILPQHCTYIAS